MPPDTVADQVLRVFDGDTILTAGHGRVRYIGIDTPEMDARDPRTRRLAAEALAANQQLVDGHPVLLAFDEERTDAYGRTLAYVWVGKVMVNGWLVEQGYARILPIPPNTRYAAVLQTLQMEARRQRRGLWAPVEESALAPGALGGRR